MPELYKTATVQRITGFKPELLRAWERRHGLLVPERSDGGHRLYTEDDLRVLLASRALLDQGRSISEIAALGRDRLLERERTGESAGFPTVDTDALGGTDALRQRLVAAAIDVDPNAVEEALDELLATARPEDAIDSVLMPASREVGDAWADGRCSVAGEHLLSSAIRERLGGLVRWADLGEEAPGGEAIVACFPGETHENGALVTAFRLARRGYRVTYLGAALPWPDLLTAIARRKPLEVFLSVAQSTRFDEARPALLATVESGAPARFWIGGRGAPETDAELDRLGALVGPGTALPSPAEVWARSPHRMRSP